MNTQLPFISLAQQQQNIPLKIKIQSNNCTRFLSLQEICTIEAQSPYSYVHLKEGKRIFAMHSIRQLQELLSQFGFMRLERSWLVNLYQLESYCSKGYGKVILSNGQQVNLPRGRKRDFQKKLDTCYL